MGCPPEAWASLSHRILFTHSLHTECMSHLASVRYRRLRFPAFDGVCSVAQDAPCYTLMELAITAYSSGQG